MIDSNVKISTTLGTWKNPNEILPNAVQNGAILL